MDSTMVARVAIELLNSATAETSWLVLEEHDDVEHIVTEVKARGWKLTGKQREMTRTSRTSIGNGIRQAELRV